MSEPTTTTSYARHVKPLFREKDREAMLRAFDLWAYPDVARHHKAIARRLRHGSMPCDGAWPPENVALFDSWVDGGLRP